MPKDSQGNSYNFIGPVGSTKECPNVPVDLLEYLDSVFPNINPSPANTLSEIFYEAGQRNVVDFLKEKRKIQTEIDR